MSQKEVENPNVIPNQKEKDGLILNSAEFFYVLKPRLKLTDLRAYAI